MIKLTATIFAFLLQLILLSGCLNPFAPELGNPTQSLWTDQQTVGELLENFRNAYNLQDSLRYSHCLSDNFVFYYHDVENEIDDQWGRDTDLKTTGGLFRTFDDVRLTWYALPDTITQFAQEAVDKEFDISFNLSLYGQGGSSAYDLYGFARFTVRKDPGAQFRILTWKDNSVF
jgi:hypothetical protein